MRPALFFFLWLSRAAAVGEEPLRISEIEIRTGNVFTPAEAAAAFFPYRLANGIHVVTDAGVIGKYLLFAVGDPIDPEKLAETERNLRGTGLFRYVLVRAIGTKVVVDTGDAWTLLLRGALSNKGGVTTYQFGVEERNVLGTGRGLKFLYDKGTERISRSVSFTDPAFLRPYTLLGLLYSNLSDGTVYEARLQRPFYSLDTPWAAGVFFRKAIFQPKQYAGGEEAAQWDEHLTIFRAEGGLRARHTANSAFRLLASIEWNDTTLEAGSFGPPPPPEDPPRRFLFIGGGVERDERKWIERSDVEKIGRVEDFNLAPVGRVELAFSPKVAGATGAARLAARGSVGTLIPSGFLTAALAAETRYENGPQNILASLDVRCVVQSGGWTLVTRVGSLAGWRLDPEFQVYLDGETGVRAYRLHAVSGSGRAVGNIELRRVFFYDVLKLVSFGAAAFVEAGTSWGPPDGSWLLADAGVGLRFGLARASQTSLLRLDIARAFRPDPLGRTGWLLSFASSQAF